MAASRGGLQQRKLRFSLICAVTTLTAGIVFNFLLATDITLDQFFVATIAMLLLGFGIWLFGLNQIQRQDSSAKIPQRAEVEAILYSLTKRIQDVLDTPWMQVSAKRGAHKRLIAALNSWCEDLLGDIPGFDKHSNAATLRAYLQDAERRIRRIEALQEQDMANEKLLENEERSILIALENWQDLF